MIPATVVSLLQTKIPKVTTTFFVNVTALVLAVAAVAVTAMTKPFKFSVAIFGFALLQFACRQKPRHLRSIQIQEGIDCYVIDPGLQAGVGFTQ